MAAITTTFTRTSVAGIARPGPRSRPFVSPRVVRRSPRRSAAVYRRRRLVAAALFLGILLAGTRMLGVLGGGSLTASEAGSPSVTAVELPLEPVSRTTHVVAPGDTLWSIARGFRPDGDVRPLVDELAADRGGRPLQVGERITLP